ncbi:MAG: RNA polymerase factor sigma-54 [Burkholderiaceae bacterium]
MKPSLQLKLSQHLALTPQLQQSIRLLQLSTLELNQELETALADNPLLERLDDPLDVYARIAPNGGLESAAGPAAGGADTGDFNGSDAGGDAAPGAGSEGVDRESTAGDADSSADWDRDGGGFGDEFGHGSGSGERNDDERSYPQIAASAGSLRDHLMSQLASTQCSPQDRALVTILIDEVNQDGYLGLELEEFAALLPEELDIDPQSISGALKLLQSFDPPGVGARNVAECLMLQLNEIQHASTSPPEALDLARTLVGGYLSELASRDFGKIKRALRCSDDELRAAQALVRSLSPRPGSAFSSEAPTYVVPDVLVKRIDGNWQAVLNRDVMPKLRINDMYAQILKRNRGGNTALSGQLQEARWLIKNVQQRFDTILRVAQAIVDRQRAFFSHGAVAMRPLVLREIADSIGLHESTVSRVTTQKFMLTPFGTFELKYFFGSHVATDSGGAASSTAIRELIKQLIQAEDARSPLSDSHIAELLGEQGIMVARRTVAKYREGLRIPAVAQRKAL